MYISNRKITVWFTFLFILKSRENYENKGNYFLILDSRVCDFDFVMFQTCYFPNRVIIYTVIKSPPKVI